MQKKGLMSFGKWCSWRSADFSKKKGLLRFGVKFYSGIFAFMVTWTNLVRGMVDWVWLLKSQVNRKNKQNEEIPWSCGGIGQGTNNKNTQVLKATRQHYNGCSFYFFVLPVCANNARFSLALSQCHRKEKVKSRSSPGGDFKSPQIGDCVCMAALYAHIYEL